MDAQDQDELLAAQGEDFERQRAALARSLHGDLGGLLVAARMALASLGPRPDAVALSRIDGQLAEALAIKQRAVEALRPGLLDHFGPAAALVAHFETRCQAEGIRLEVDVAAGLPMPVTAAGVLLYRIGEASLALALRDKATAIGLRVSAEADLYRLRVIAESVGAAPADTRDLDMLARWAGRRGLRVEQRLEGCNRIVEVALRLG